MGYHGEFSRFQSDCFPSVDPLCDRASLNVFGELKLTTNETQPCITLSLEFAFIHMILCCVLVLYKYIGVNLFGPNLLF